MGMFNSLIAHILGELTTISADEMIVEHGTTFNMVIDWMSLCAIFPDVYSKRMLWEDTIMTVEPENIKVNIRSCT